MQKKNPRGKDIHLCRHKRNFEKMKASLKLLYIQCKKSKFIRDIGFLKLVIIARVHPIDQ